MSREYVNVYEAREDAPVFSYNRTKWVKRGKAMCKILKLLLNTTAYPY
jgi:hypothetical protein